MQLSVTERERLYAILEKYDQNPKVQQMREFIQHGDVTTYQHCRGGSAQPPPASLGGTGSGMAGRHF